MALAGPQGLAEQLEELLGCGAGGGGRPGRPPCGRLVLERVRGRTVATGSFASYPLKFMLPSQVGSAGADAVWAYVITYGGGILSGDLVAMSLELGEGCTGVLTTQGSTKIYRASEGKAAEQHVHVQLGPGSLLAVLPDPVTCFRGARYGQQQACHLAPGASLVLVDWLTSGRRERDEAWVFDSYDSCNRIYSEPDGRLLLLDKVHLEQEAGLSVREKMHGFHVYGIVVAIGPRTAEVQDALVAGTREVTLRNSGDRRRQRMGQPHRGSQPLVTGVSGSDGPGPRKEPQLHASCSPLEGGGVIVRVAGATTEEVYGFLRRQLALLAPQLGAAPYSSVS